MKKTLAKLAASIPHQSNIPGPLDGDSTKIAHFRLNLVNFWFAMEIKYENNVLSIGKTNILGDCGQLRTARRG